MTEVCRRAKRLVKRCSGLVTERARWERRLRSRVSYTKLHLFITAYVHDRTGCLAKASGRVCVSPVLSSLVEVAILTLLTGFAVESSATSREVLPLFRPAVFRIGMMHSLLPLEHLAQAAKASSGLLIHRI
jgi:hypothetical protein